MDAARIPWAWRDYCAHLLIPLNKCRRLNAYLPWACHHEKHVYEKCQYKVGPQHVGRAWDACGVRCACCQVDQLPGGRGAKHTAAAAAPHPDALTTSHPCRVAVPSPT